MKTEISQTLSRDLTPDFIETWTDELRGEYDFNYEILASPPGGFEPRRNPVQDECDLAIAGRRRREAGKRSLIRTCERIGVPYQHFRLHCNGQFIVVAQLGQLLLIPEPIRYVQDRPLSSAYKTELASSHFSVRQLEMDLNDGYKQRIDARNTLLVVLQHGMSGDEFSRRGTALSMLRVAVPDCSFSSWIWHADALNSELEFRLDWNQAERPQTMQIDKVNVSLRSADVNAVRS